RRAAARADDGRDRHVGLGFQGAGEGGVEVAGGAHWNVTFRAGIAGDGRGGRRGLVRFTDKVAGAAVIGGTPLGARRPAGLALGWRWRVCGMGTATVGLMGGRAFGYSP